MSGRGGTSRREAEALIKSLAQEEADLTAAHNLRLAEIQKRRAGLEDHLARGLMLKPLGAYDGPMTRLPGGARSEEGRGTLSVVFPPDLADHLDNLASFYDCGQADVVRELVAHHAVKDYLPDETVEGPVAVFGSGIVWTREDLEKLLAIIDGGHSWTPEDWTFVNNLTIQLTAALGDDEARKGGGQ